MSHALAADVEPRGGEFRVHARRARRCLATLSEVSAWLS